MTSSPAEALVEQLARGQRFRFADWPIAEVPQLPGLYTIWDGDQFLYVGMAGRVNAGSPIRGFRGRLNSHASGRRSGDQFCIYISDRLIVPELEPGELEQVRDGQLLLDALTRDYVRSRLEFRFAVTSDDQAARNLEGRIKRFGLPGLGKPLLNPDARPD